MVCAMTRPVIGICTALERARWSVWDQEAALLPHNYIQAVQAAGGLALLLAPDPLLVRAPGRDPGPARRADAGGRRRHRPGGLWRGARMRRPSTRCPRGMPSSWRSARAAIARELPVLGICRGMQLINVACGGTLLQHLPERFGHHEHRRVVGSFDGADHDVLLRAGSLAAGVAGESRHSTKSHHHQGVDRVGAGLTVSGTSTLDELPEAIEWDESPPAHSPPRRFVLGVQWHPEADEQSPFVGALVAAAAAASGRDGDGG